jgi:hypothetical protein
VPKIFKSRFFIILLISALIFPSLLALPVVAVGSYPYTTSDPEVADALNYLRSTQTSDGKIESFSASAWVVMAITAAGEDPNDWKDNLANPSIVDYLAANAATASSANAYSKMIMAAVAAGEDPTDFGERDFVALLEAEHNNNQIGDETCLNDDFWGVMALVAAGKDPATSTIIQDSVAFIIANQDVVDDGWGWSVGGGFSDVDNTAAAIMALIAGQSPNSEAISDGLDYIKGTQQDNGGLLSWGDTNADSDSWGICGIAAAGEVPTDWDSGMGNDPVDHLLTFQQEGSADDGAFYWQDGTPGMSPAGTTAAAIIALVGNYFPVAVLEPEPPEPGVTVNVRIEGKDGNIWNDSVTVDDSWITADNSGIEYYLEDPTAMGALDEAATEGDFEYETTDEWGGLFVTSINGEEGEGMAGWMYRVDYASPSVGADQFILDETSPPDPPHQEVLFYYGEYTDIPLKLEVDNIAPDAGDSFTITVSEYDESLDEWYPIEGATVYADTSYTSDENGKVDITIYGDATLEVYAEKDGYIRSNQVTVTVGEGSSQPDEFQHVSMTVDIIPAISFSVSPDYINFGLMGPRDVSDPVTITLTNEGAWKLAITTMVSDDADNLYVDGLKINSTKWNNFEGTVRRDHSEDYTVTLTVPEAYTLTGEQNGTIIFWAAESPY